eukprot:jgi/Ulvmu1/3855/UM018_0074.1
MANFSGAIKIGDVNDFISPSQACVLNLDGSLDAKSKVTIPQEAMEKPKVTGFQQTTTDASTNAIKVSLQDCLACSGCVTTAETMLLQHQSTDELLSKLQDPSVTVVASVSHQSIASLAAKYNVPMHTCAQRLAGFLKGLGVSTVLSIQTARSLALAETASDLVHRFRAAYPGVPSQLNITPGQTSAQSTTDTREPQALQPAPSAAPHPGFPWQLPPGPDANTLQQTQCCKSPQPRSADTARDRDANGAARRPPLPLLVSACPGWVCYAEKTHGEWILPFLSTAKSPQAMAGSIIKGALTAAASTPDASWIEQAPADCGCHGGGELRSHVDGGAAGGAGAQEPVCCADGMVEGVSGGSTGGGGGGAGPGVDGGREAAARALRASVYHVSIMPCYDKKLEAARADFAMASGGGGAAAAASGGKQQEWGAAEGAVPETDSVLTTAEVHELLEARGVRLSEDIVAAQPLDDWGPFLVRGGGQPGAAGGTGGARGDAARAADGQRGPGAGCGAGDMETDGPARSACSREDCCAAAGEAAVPGRLPGVRGGSGGYLEYAVKHAAWALHGLDLGEAPLPLRAVRSADFQEVVIEKDGRCVLRAAQAYGFRNIQNLVRKIKSGRCPYDIVEVMACPSGCLNGGGQIKVPGGHSELQKHIRHLHSVYHDEDSTSVVWPGQDAGAHEARGAAVPAPLRTQFHKREKTLQAAVVDW